MRPGHRRREPTRLPARFRWRLTAAFVLVAAVAAGVVAVLGILIANEYRWRAYRDRSDDEAGLVLALAPDQLDADRFERLRRRYELRSEADVVAQGRTGSYSSSAAIGPGDVPAQLREVAGAEPEHAEAVAAGRHYLVVGARAESGDRYWLFFSVEVLRASLGELIRASAAAFLLTVGVACAVGRHLAVRTLRPVAAAAEAAEDMRAGRRGTRLPEGPDEFGALAASFNRMVDTVQETIAQLERSAERERRFTADVAHELRTPLTGIAASAGLLDESLPALRPTPGDRRHCSSRTSAVCARSCSNSSS